MSAIDQYTSGQDIMIWGQNTTVGTSPELLYQANQDMDIPTQLGTGVALDITSSAVADDNGSTGATQVRIVGLDANFGFQYEDVTMDGRTIVTTTKLWRDVFGMDVIAHGTGNTNAGDIYAVATGTGGSYTNGVPGTVTSLVAKMLAGWNVSMNGKWTVPLNAGTYRLRMLQVEGHTQASTVWLALRQPWATDKTQHLILPIGLGNGSSFNADLTSLGISITEKTTISMRAAAATPSASITGSFILRRQ
jgi:hypothetical protein